MWYTRPTGHVNPAARPTPVVPWRRATRTLSGEQDGRYKERILIRRLPPSRVVARFVVLALAATTLALAAPSCAHAAPGDLDATFGNGGVAALPNAVRELRLPLNGPLRMPDGKLVYYGTASPPFSNLPQQALIERFLPDGTRDSGFGSNGRVVLDDVSDIVEGALTVQSTGHLIAFISTSTGSIARRFDASGAVDPNWGASFAGLGSMTSSNQAMVDSQDRVYVFSHQFAAGGTNPKVVGARLSASAGATEATYGSDLGIAGLLAAMTIDRDGVPVVATRTSLTWLSSPPVTKPLQIFNAVRSVAVDNAGRLLVVGERRVNGVSEAAVQRYVGQSLDASFGSGGTFGIDLDVTDMGWTTAF